MSAVTVARDADTMCKASALFRAMGCRVEIHLVHDPAPQAMAAVAAALLDAETFFETCETALSRFRPTSDLSLLNRAAGSGPMLVSPLLGAAMVDALAAARATDGMFDPTLGTVMAVLGYDRPFPLVAADDAGVPLLVPVHREGAWREIVVDAAGGTIALPVGVALDLGGIGKGWTVDRLVAQLETVPGVYGGLINAGGDLRVWGDAPESASAWAVGVEDPREFDRDCAVLAVRDGAVATSSTAYRRWRRGDRWLHHLLDPRTGQPAATDAAAVTVVGPSAMWAEVHAKVALLHGMETGRAYLDARDGYEGLLIAVDGGHEQTTGMGGYLR
jgi:thiamine biosynthesis lipoprotein